MEIKTTTMQKNKGLSHLFSHVSITTTKLAQQSSHRYHTRNAMQCKTQMKGKGKWWCIISLSECVAFCVVHKNRNALHYRTWKKLFYFFWIQMNDCTRCSALWSLVKPIWIDWDITTAGRTHYTDSRESLYKEPESSRRRRRRRRRRMTFLSCW